MFNLFPEGGLCNRLRTIESGVRLARASELPLCVCWKLQGWAMNSRWSDLFEVPNGVFSIKEYARHSLWSRLLVSRFNPWRVRPEHPNKIVQMCINKPLKFLPITHFNYAEFYVDSISRDYSWLKPVGSIQSEISRELVNLGDEYIGIHIRRTDNSWAIEKSPISLFIKRISEEISVNPCVKFFLATDDEATRQVLLARFPGVIYSRRNVAERSATGGVADAVIDLMLLARAGKVIGSFGSSFSVVASQIRGVPLEILTNDSMFVEHDERSNWRYLQPH